VLSQFCVEEGFLELLPIRVGPIDVDLEKVKIEFNGEEVCEENIGRGPRVYKIFGEYFFQPIMIPPYLLWASRARKSQQGRESVKEVSAFWLTIIVSWRRRIKWEWRLISLLMDNILVGLASLR
jgi:hypothetical protein